jgi:hypothetical protein
MNEHLITMRDGCAGFFTEAEVAGSGGILLTERERVPRCRGKTPGDWRLTCAHAAVSPFQMNRSICSSQRGCSPVVSVQDLQV